LGILKSLFFPPRLITMAGPVKAAVSLATLSQQLKECTELTPEEVQALQAFAVESGLFDEDVQTPNNNWSPAASISGGKV
jgi:hypothetical protein